MTNEEQKEMAELKAIKKKQEPIKFDLSTKKRPPARTEPRSLMIYSLIKAGKTAICAQIIKSILIEMELGGADAVEAAVVEINDPKQITPLLLQIKENKEIKVIVIDTLTQMDAWSELTGTWRYMKKPQGKKFNRQDGRIVKSNEPAFDTVHSIGQGYGYRYSRDEMRDWYNQIIQTGKIIVFLAHLRDKFIESESGDIVETSEIDLTGKVRTMLGSRIDAVAALKREGNKSYLVFDTIGTTAGSRYAYLKGKMLIGESDEYNVLTTYWDTIFPNLYK